MDYQDYITESVERKKGQHLQREERGAIQHLKNAGYTNRAIARAIGCSPTTVGNELKRGTPPPKEQQGQEARILGKAWRSGLQGEQKAFSETTPNLVVVKLSRTLHTSNITTFALTATMAMLRLMKRVSAHNYLDLFSH